jgi:hypothetical protein
MFSRFLGGSKQLKPPYKQGGEAQNAKIVFTRERFGFLLVTLARAEQVQEFRRNVLVMFQ